MRSFLTSGHFELFIDDPKRRLEIINMLELEPRKGNFDARKFCGAITLVEDPMILQRRWRDEW